MGSDEIAGTHLLKHKLPEDEINGWQDILFVLMEKIRIVCERNIAGMTKLPSDKYVIGTVVRYLSVHSINNLTDTRKLQK